MISNLNERWVRGRRIDRRSDTINGGLAAGFGGGAIECQICGKMHEISYEVYPRSTHNPKLLVGEKCMKAIVRRPQWKINQGIL